MTSASKHVHIDKLDDIVDKCNNTYNSTIKLKPVDVKANTYFDSSKEINDKVFVIDIVKNIVQWTCIMNDLNEEEIVGMLYEK